MEIVFVYLSRIRHIIVVMVNDSSLFLIKFDATLTAQLPQRVTCAYVHKKGEIRANFDKEGRR